jgi:hypothetical protein
MKKTFLVLSLFIVIFFPCKSAALTVNVVTDIQAGNVNSCTNYRCITNWKSSFQEFLDNTSGMILTVGDNLDTPNLSVKEALLKMAGEREIYWANGNHDKKMYVGGLKHYVIDKEDWRIIILASSAARSKSERQWLESKLKGFEDKKVLVLEHHPIFRQGKTKVLSNQKSIKKIYEKYKVDYVFSGHWHGDKYTRTINGVTYQAFQGLTYGYKINYKTVELD